MQRTTRVLLGCLLFTSWATSLGAQWYKVPPGGNVTFTLTELWGVFKGIPPSSFVQGEASITVEYQDGTTEQIGFQDSGLGISRFVEDQDGLGLSLGTGQWSGTNVWTQTASLVAGSVFQIVSATPAQAYAQDVEFQGGTGAFLKGFVNKFSVDAPPVTQPSGPATTSNIPPSPPSPPGGAPSNIHAVIVSGLSDPAKVIVSSNVRLTGGIVALGKNGSPSSTSSAWSPGLRIIPDYALLTGAKIPPVTPNIIDVRIVRQNVTADFPSPNPKPDN
ncbi:MAG: hypothetical protein JOZ31_10365 [Verrucomicrobia bacterium]|nr:hypothetical protein [Verrucomicrobiota bacterium]MBV8481535.1 hypothetical protein [Verrucomicrobiota bacterium]